MKSGEITFDCWKKADTETVKLFAGVFDICYYSADKRLTDLFKEQQLTHNLLNNRVRVLNTEYHTRLWEKDIKRIIEKLQAGGKQFEDRIRNNDKDVVKEIAEFSGNKFVFATKYCSFINPKNYPIYDAFIGKMLEYFQTEYKFYKNGEVFKMETIKNSKDYQKFVEIIDAFRDKRCKECEYREIDKYLWLVGKNEMEI